MMNFKKWLKPILESKKNQEWQIWMEAIDKEFEEWAEEQKEEAIQEKEDSCWTEWDERLFQGWVDEEKERYEDKQWEKFVDWFEDHFGNGSNWQEKMYELFEKECACL